jgi:non-specific serine/threonine protein kinase
MSVGRNHVAGVVLDGRFYVLGGRPPFSIATAERYDPATNTWTTLAPLNTPRSGFPAVAVGGRVVVFGGEGAGIIPSTEAYDPATNTWTPLPDMRTPRHGHGGVAKGRRVYALEGGPTLGGSSSDALEYLDVK